MNLHDVSGSVDVTDEVGSSGSLGVSGTLSDGASITIADQSGTGTKVSFGEYATLAGDLTLESSLKADQEVTVYGHLRVSWASDTPAIYTPYLQVPEST